MQQYSLSHFIFSGDSNVLYDFLKNMFEYLHMCSEQEVIINESLYPHFSDKAENIILSLAVGISHF